MQVRGPIVAGGVQGSGTRVVAEILRRSGVYIGNDLNASLDSRTFVLLFLRPSWYAREKESGGDEIHRALDVFERAMTGRLRLSPAALGVIAAATRDRIERQGSTRDGLIWSLKRARHMRGSKGPGSEATAWGWKNPISHTYLPELAAHFDGLRYVLVMRHGLDMAVKHEGLGRPWWDVLGLGEENEGEPINSSLRYWVAANRRAIGIGRALLGDRFHVLRYDDLCRDPRTGIAELLDFAQLDTSPAEVSVLAALVRPASTIGRHHSRLDDFTVEELESVRQLGFDVTA